MARPFFDDGKRRRTRMVERDIESRGISDARVLAAMRTVPRERFLPEDLAEFTHDDSPLPIEQGQTISQPYIVASMATCTASTRREMSCSTISTGSIPRRRRLPGTATGA